MPHIILLGTLDTKLEEFLYLHQQLQSLSTSTPNPQISPLKITFIDCGRSNTEHELITITQPSLLTHFSPSPTASPPNLTSMPRNEVITYMTQCATSCIQHLIRTSPVHGILGAGGSGGTSLISAVMRSAPLGMPKLIVSTVASSVEGESDIATMYSVVDIAGTNALLRTILRNAAGAMLGMSCAYEMELKSLEEKKAMEKGKGEERVTRIGITMFGVTTPCVTAISKHLREKYPVEIYVFHATGHGGKALERMIAEGKLDAVLDLTTTEICDHLFGGNMSAGPTRLEAALRAGIPNIISIGATDMVNFGTRGTVPGEYRERNLLEHNSLVTLMRTTKEECVAVGEFIVEKIKRFAKEKEMVEVWLPSGGVSVISTLGAVFEDKQADAALVETVRKGLDGVGVRVVLDKRHINDEEFARDIADSLMALVPKKGAEIE